MKRTDLDNLLRQELRRPVQSPDLSRAIMGRLGYMQVSPDVARRRRVQRWLGRTALVAMLIAVGNVGVMVFKASPEARQPLEFTIPSAIRSDLQHQQYQINSVIQLLRELPPRLEHDNTQGTAPSPGSSPGMYPADSDWLDADPHEVLDDDVNHSAVGPMRWA